jgi:hypothetical protein
MAPMMLFIMEEPTDWGYFIAGGKSIPISAQLCQPQITCTHAIQIIIILIIASRITWE